MLSIVELSSWEEFENKIKSNLKYEIEGRVYKDSGSNPYDPILYRGQTNAEWGLDTTLERHLGKNKSIKFYNNLIKTIASELETFTGKRWDSEVDDIKNSLLAGRYGLTENVMKLLPLEYMSYLRHYGFPSPLLDWTSSPYIAAYFAFHDMVSNAKQVAIFQYHQIYNHLSTIRKDPVITPLAINPSYYTEGVRNNKRHYHQQSVYTICIDAKAEKPYFVNHENVYLIANEEDKFEDRHKGEYLTKYILPSSERETALMHLEMYNINSFSLMGTEESLLETLFARHISPYKVWKDLAPTSYSALDE